MQGLPDDVRDSASAPAVTAERAGASPRPSRLNRWCDAIALGLIAATLIRVSSLLLASWLPTVEQLAEPGYVLLRWLAAFAVFAATLAIQLHARHQRAGKPTSSYYSCYSVSKFPAVITGLLLAEFFSDYRGTSFFVLKSLLPRISRPSTPDFDFAPLTLLLILIHSTGILTIAALGYSIRSRSKPIANDSDPTRTRL